MPKTVTESDLVIPTLIALEKRKESGLSTSELQPILRRRLKPEGEDLVALQGRNDDKFSQKVRNLRAHKRLERDGYAEFRDGRYYITGSGELAVRRLSGFDKSLSAQGFSETQKAEALEKSATMTFVEEGQETQVKTKVKKRSAKLRALAVEHFSDAEGRIQCEGCGFEGSSAYGTHGKGLIEIHHKKPIFLEGKTKKILREALADLSPLCPTCHRMVHRDPNSVLSIEALQNLISA